MFWSRIAFITFSFILYFSICSYTQEVEEESLTEEASEEVKGIQISGSIDSYFRANLNGDYDESPGTSFANLPGFALGMANLIVEQASNKFGFKADLVFGPRGEDATFLSPFLRPGGTSSIINQLYVFWNVSDAITITLGNFNTFLGYEVISPTDNFNYSTSYMFSYGPFSHSGIKADITLSDQFTLMAGVFNPTDATEFNPDNKFVGGLQLAYENGGLGVWLNGLFSDEFSQVDITAGYEIGERYFVGLNATRVSNNFMGLGAYFQVAPADDLKLGLRIEKFRDKGLGLFSMEEDVLDFTVSANYVIGKLTFIPEFRIDKFSEEIIADGDDLTDSLSSFVLAAVYAF